MASSSRKMQAPLFLAAALLVLVCTRGLAARPVPGSSSSGHMAQHAVPTSVQEKSGSSGAGTVMDHDEPEAAMRECEGADEQECLMRRTLVAHTDYIYTQGKHN